MKYLYTILLSILFLGYAKAQCGGGEVEIQIEINTDSYGYEGYWELVSSDSSCGQGTILSGGNSQVGCNGGGLQNQFPGGYGNNSTYTSSTACLIEGNEYKLIYVDDWGDGGFEFHVTINGFLIASFEGSGDGNAFTFIAQEPPAYNLTMIHPHLNLYQQPGNIDIEAEVYNSGTETITSLELIYKVDNGSPISQMLTGLNIAHGESEHITHGTPWSVGSNGDYEIIIWSDNLNGNNADADVNDDSAHAKVSVGPPKPNVVDSYLINLPVVTQIAGSSNAISSPTDLDFHPVLTRKELWVVNKDFESTGSSTVTIYNAGEENQSSEWRRDGNAWHFMSLTTGLAFSDNGNFGTSPGVYDANHDGGQPFTGPALWSSDPEIYAQPSGGNGSHMDMLHESPECQGIAHEIENAFWVFDGYNNDVVRYDFVDDHGPGNDDHSDGIVHRFSEVSVSKDPNDKVPSHLVYDDESDWLYVVDYGNSRVFALDTKSGTLGATPSFGPFETLAEYRHVENYDWEMVADSGLIEPSGIDLMGEHMIVSDYNTGEIILYNRSSLPATEVKRLETGAEGIMGVCFGPDGKIWYVDYDAKTVNRIDWVADSTLGAANISVKNTFSVFPNPADHHFTIHNKSETVSTWTIQDQMGRTVLQGIAHPGRNSVEHFLAPGTYFIRMKDHQTNSLETHKIIIY